MWQTIQAKDADDGFGPTEVEPRLRRREDDIPYGDPLEASSNTYLRSLQLPSCRREENINMEYDASFAAVCFLSAIIARGVG